MVEVLDLSMADVMGLVDKIVEQANEFKWDTVIAVMRGGMVPARLIAGRLGVPNIVAWDSRYGTLGEAKGATLLIDDIVDSGRTMEKAKLVFGDYISTAALVSKVAGIRFVGLDMSNDSRWARFFWESPSDRVGERQTGGT